MTSGPMVFVRTRLDSNVQQFFLPDPLFRNNQLAAPITYLGVNRRFLLPAQLG